MTRGSLLLTCGMVAATAGGCREQQAFVEPEPGLERMQEQPRLDPFAASSFYRDGMAMRRPPEGSVPLELGVDDPRIVDGVEHATYVDRIPIEVDRTLLERGRLRFEVFCAACHGITGDGTSVVAQNMQLRKPPSLMEDRIRALPRGRLYQIIRDGYGLMPGYAAQLSLEERWATVAYVLALQISRRSDVRALPQDVRAELEKVH